MADQTVLFAIDVELDRATGEVRKFVDDSNRKLDDLKHEAQEAGDAVEDLGDDARKAGAGMDDFSDKADRARGSADNAGKKTLNLGKEMRGASEAISATTTATQLLGGGPSSAMGALGGNIASLLSSGLGPLGIGLAVVTTAASLFAGSLSEISEEAEEAEARLEGMREETAKLRAERDLLAAGVDPSTREVSAEVLRRQLASEIVNPFGRGGGRGGAFGRDVFGSFEPFSDEDADERRRLAGPQLGAFTIGAAENLPGGLAENLTDDLLTERGRALRDQIVRLEEQDRIQRDIDQRRKELQEERKRRIEEEFRLLKGLASGSGAPGAAAGGLPGAPRPTGSTRPFGGDFESLAAQSGVPFRSPFFGSGPGGIGGLPGSTPIFTLPGVRSEDEIRRDREAFELGAERNRLRAEFDERNRPPATRPPETADPGVSEFGQTFGRSAASELRRGLLDFAEGGDAGDIGARLGQALGEAAADQLAAALVQKLGTEELFGEGLDAIGGVFGLTGGGPGTGDGAPATTTGARK